MSTKQKQTAQKEQNKKQGKRNTGWKQLPELQGKSVENSLKALQKNRVSTDISEQPPKQAAKKQDHQQSKGQNKVPMADISNITKSALGIEQPLKVNSSKVEQLYQPQNLQPSTDRMIIYRPYFEKEKPVFYQPPQWTFICEPDRNQNTKTKTIDVHSTAKVQVDKKPNAFEKASERKHERNQEKEKKEVSIAKRLKKIEKLLEKPVGNPLSDHKNKSVKSFKNVPQEDSSSYESDDGSEEADWQRQLLQRAGNPKPNKSHDKGSGKKFDRKEAELLKKKKLKAYEKQMKEIFDPKFNPQKSKTVNKNLYVNDKVNSKKAHGKQPKEKVNGYANTGAMPYDDKDKESAQSDDSDLKMLSEMEVHQVYNSRYPKKHQNFDMKREKNISNQVFSQGKGRQQHREKEKFAKDKRLKNFPQKQNDKNRKSIYEPHITDQAEIDQRIEEGTLFKGVIRMNAKFRNRAYVVVPEFNLDVVIEGQNFNRAFDQDQVLIELESVTKWQQVKTAAENEKKYSNTGAVDSVVEKRAIDKVDKKEGKPPAPIAPVKEDVKEQEDTESIEDIEDLDQDDGDDVWESAGESDDADDVDDEDSSDLERVAIAALEQDGIDFDEEDFMSDMSDDSLEREQPQQAGKKKQQRMYSFDKPKVVVIQKQDIPNELKKDMPNGLKELKGDYHNRLKYINDVAGKFRPSGKVVGILESSNRQKEIMCTLVELKVGGGKDQKKGKNKPKQGQKGKKSKDDNDDESTIVLAAPVDQKIPWFNIKQEPKEYFEDQKAGKKIGSRYYVCKFSDWTEFNKKALCHITESIGEAGNLDAEAMRLLKTYDICTEAYEDENMEPTQNVHECLKMFSKDIDPATKEWIIPQSEIDKRLDLRKKRIFTIDPITAKDLDDALSIEKISEKIYEIGVHIADVSFFVKQGTDLDKEAVKRCTSTYLVHRVYPMLPRLLCERLCSLNPKVDRLAYSIFFRMNIETGQLQENTEPRIARSVIRTCAKWNYELVQKVLDREIMRQDQLDAEYHPQGHTFDDMVQDCFLMNEIAQRRRSKRLENGSVMFLNREFHFNLDKETRLPTDFSEIKKMQSKSLVEEYMLLANILIAEYLFKYCKDKTLLRAHNDIAADKKEKLYEFMNKIGLKGIDLSTAKTFSHSLEALKATGNQDDLNVLNRKFLTCLTQAKYLTVQDLEPSEYQHYGLNFPLYTHFTSPIRRYADLLVHRLLTISLAEQENTRSLIDAIDYQEYAEQCSEKSLNARKASKEGVRLFHCLMLKQEGKPRVTESLIFEVEAQQICLYIEEINQHFNLRLKEDPRFDYTDLSEDQVSVICSLKPKVSLAKDHPCKYLANKKAEDDSKKIEHVKLGIYQKVMIKIETTQEFPLDFKITLVLTEDDLEEYNDLLAEQKSSHKAPAVKASQVVEQETGDGEF